MLCYDKTEILIKVLGAGQTVGRSCVLVELKNRRILFDCGVHLGFKDERRYPNFSLITGENPYEGNRYKGDEDNKSRDVNISIINTTISNKEQLIQKLKRVNDIIDCVIITHFHMDHIGALPFFTEVLKYKGPVLMSYPTKALSPILLYDSCKLTDSRWEKKNVDRQMKAIGENASDFYKFSMNNLAKDPLNITEDDVYACMRRVIGLQINETYQLGDIKITPYYAGHVLGACIFKIEVNGFRVIYTGDYNTVPDKHLGSVRIPAEKPEILISESTYATYIRPTRKSSELELCNLVHECVNKGGKVLIPVFAIGRAQELSILLDSYWEKMKINFPIYFGGGLTESANQYYSIYSSWTNSYCVSSKIRKNLFDFKHIGPFLYNYLEENRPMVLFATPGMLHTGLALRAFKSWATSPKNLVVLPGYCVQGTIGNKLLMGEKKIQVNSTTTIDVLCKVIYLSFSAHADSNGIQQLVKHVYPKQVIFVHGEKGGMEKLAKYIQKEQSIPSFYPAMGQPCSYNFQKRTVEYVYMESSLYKKLMKKKKKNVKQSKKELLKRSKDHNNNSITLPEGVSSAIANLKVMTKFSAFLFCFPLYRKDKTLVFFLPRKIIVHYLKKKHIHMFLSHKGSPIEVLELLRQAEKTTSSLEDDDISFELNNKKKRKEAAHHTEEGVMMEQQQEEEEEDEGFISRLYKMRKTEDTKQKHAKLVATENEKCGSRLGCEKMKKYEEESKSAQIDVQEEEPVKMEKGKEVQEKKEEKEEKAVKENKKENEKKKEKTNLKGESADDENESNLSSDSSDDSESDNRGSNSLHLPEYVTLPFFNLRYKESINIEYKKFYNFVLTFFQQIIKTKEKKKVMKEFGKQIFIKNVKFEDRYFLYLTFHSLRAVHDGQNSLILQWSYLDNNPNSAVRNFINSIRICSQ